MAEGGAPLPLLSTPDTSSVARKAVAAFPYGNGVPCTLAVNFVKAYAGVDDDDGLLLQIFDDYYYKWAASTTYHLAMFWDMLTARYMWLNGPYGPHTDVTGPNVGFESVCGFGTLPRALRMHRRLFSIRSTVHIF